MLFWFGNLEDGMDGFFFKGSATSDDDLWLVGDGNVGVKGGSISLVNCFL
jgi:hypothetical protein